MQCEGQSNANRCAAQSNAMQCKAIEEPNEPDEPEELRESRDGKPDERYREARAGGHKYHRVSFVERLEG